MDIKINDTNGQYLEYNTIGGVFDFYFVSGPSPVDVAQQITGVIGVPANIPYSGLGFHQCRYGYRDVYEVAGMVYNYSQAAIPLECAWTDIDYMHSRWIMTVSNDEEYLLLGCLAEQHPRRHGPSDNFSLPNFDDLVVLTANSLILTGFRSPRCGNLSITSINISRNILSWLVSDCSAEFRDLILNIY